MYWVKTNYNEYHGYEWESDQSDEALRAVLIKEEGDNQYRLDTMEIDSNLDIDELQEIISKLVELNGESK